MPKQIEVVAKDFDGDLGRDSGQHMADQMGQGLFHFVVDPWDVVEFLSQGGQCRFTCQTALGIERHNVLGHIDPFGVFVHFRSTTASHKRGDESLGIFFARTKMRRQGRIDHGTRPVRGFER